MKQKLLALVATLTALGAGTVVFMRWETGEVDVKLEQYPDQWEWVDKSSCTVSACSTANCAAALRHLQDAGSSCTPRRVACDFRVSQRMRNCFADAGSALTGKRYQRVELTAIRCPGIDGGLTFGAAFDDEGCPVDAPVMVTPLCVRAPAGNSTCTRAEGDGGFRFFGEMNVFPASLAGGSGCEAVGCSIMFGDSDTDL